MQKPPEPTAEEDDLQVESLSVVKYNIKSASSAPGPPGVVTQSLIYSKY